MKKKLLSTLTLCAFVFSGLSINVQAQNKERVTFGIDLTDVQETEMLKEFGVSADKVTIDRVTNDDIVKQLGLDPKDPSNYVGGCYSSSYVKLTDKDGVIVTAHNLTEVSGLMLSNALLTSGVINAEVKASSPFPVTGTSALSGILKGFEAIQGSELSLKNKKTAQKEIETTSSLADEIGFDEAATVINDIKTEVIKDSPKTKEEVSSIVNDVTKDYTIELSEDQKANITALMVDINDLDIDYSKVKDTLNNLSDQLSNALKEAGSNLSESGFFQKVFNSIGDFFSGIVDWFKSLFTTDSTNETIEPESDNSSNTTNTEDIPTSTVDTPSDTQSSNEEDTNNTYTNAPSSSEEHSAPNSTNENNVDSSTENQTPDSDTSSNEVNSQS